jgi:hypothetical protein
MTEAKIYSPKQSLEIVLRSHLLSKYVKILPNGTVKPKRGEPITQGDLSVDLHAVALKSSWGCPPEECEALVQTVLNEWIEQHLKSVDPEMAIEQKMSVSAFVDQFAARHGYAIHDGRWSDGKGGNFMTLLRILWDDSNNLPAGITAYRFNRSEIENRMARIEDEAALTARQAILKEIEYDSLADTSLLPQFCNAVIGKASAKDIAIVAHFIWQVKRKMKEWTVTNHIFTVFYGPSRIGKTEAINRLVSPLKTFCAPVNVDIVSDERWTTIYEKNFVLYADEMARASKAELDSLKNKITAATFSHRPLGSSNIISIKNNATFVGSSNNPLPELIADTTGMMRFYQINCADTLKDHWDEINKIDYIQLWQSVKEDGPSPIEAFIPELRKVQEVYRAQTPIQQWIEDSDGKMRVPCEAWDTIDLVRLKSLYDAFAYWQKTTGIKARDMTMTKFSKMLEAEGYTKRRASSGKDKGQICFELPAGHGIGTLNWD